MEFTQKYKSPLSAPTLTKFLLISLVILSYLLFPLRRMVPMLFTLGLMFAEDSAGNPCNSI